MKEPQIHGKLDASCRVALAAYLHDLGKFAERARMEVAADVLAAHKTLYCPWHSTDASGKRGYHSHVHAAYTSLALDLIERHAPELVDADMVPFASGRKTSDSAENGAGAEADQHVTDSLANAAAAHHRPDTFLQWIVATADRVASGFEREEFEAYNAAGEENKRAPSGRNHYQARMLSLFEQVQLEGGETSEADVELQWRYPLEPLSPQAIFPKKRAEYEPTQDGPAQQEYAELWQGFLRALEVIPVSHRSHWPLWLDHFDTAWLTFTQAIPAATAFGAKPEVSLYDHSKAVAALAVALWRWHDFHGKTDIAAATLLKNRSDWDEHKFLLVQGDFFGIQDFIFADGSQTRKNAARMLRGRSFQVSLFSELAALRVLDALGLPPTSQISNAAGKFLIVAPNTADARRRLEQVQTEFNQWFLEHGFGMAGVGLAMRAACCNDFLERRPEHRFRALMDGLFADLDRAKLQRFNLVGSVPNVFQADYSQGVCAYNERLPADRIDAQTRIASSALSRDQIGIGKNLARRQRLLVLRVPDALATGPDVLQLELSVFGYSIGFTGDEAASGKFGKLASTSVLARCWDFSLPEDRADTCWHGYARRHINAFVPHVSQADLQTQAKYAGLREEFDPELLQRDIGKTLNHIACEDRWPRGDKVDDPASWTGQIALMTLKGDVDNLGSIFQHGLKNPTFAKMAALSRQVNAFFAVYLPALCVGKYPNIYTVFAGGDDFFLIGPWRSTQRLAVDLAKAFRNYVAENPSITFSAGMVMTKPGLPMHTLAAQAEAALGLAKDSANPDAGTRKNAVVVHGERVRWPDWSRVDAAQQQLDALRESYGLSTGYVYSLLGLVDLTADEDNPESAMWRSRFAYRTRRYVVDQLKGKSAEQRTQAQTELATAIGEQGINALGTRYRIALFNHLYHQR